MTRFFGRDVRNLKHSKTTRFKEFPRQPLNNEGYDGDLGAFRSAGGIKLCVKAFGRWFFLDSADNVSDNAIKADSLEDNGFVKLVNGFVIQWGEQSSSYADWLNDSSHDIIFPIPSPRKCFKVMAGFETTTNLDGCVGISAKSKTGCTFRFDEWGSVVQNGKFVYIAIGN